MQESAIIHGKSTANIVHQAASNKEHNRGGEAVANGPNDTEDHEKPILTIGVHENGSNRSNFLLLSCYSHARFLIIIHFPDPFLGNKHNAVSKIRTPLFVGVLRWLIPPKTSFVALNTTKYWAVKYLQKPVSARGGVQNFSTHIIILNNLI